MTDLTWKPADAEQPDGSLWVASRLAPDGRYAAVVTLGGGPAPLVLPPTAALRYCRTVAHAAACAAHDAAVLRQLQALGVTLTDAAQLVAESIRPGRTFEDGATRPLRFRPLVSARTGEPLLELTWPGGPGAQLDAAAATEHAAAVLEVTAAAELDAAYYRLLVAELGMGEVRARAAVDDLGRFRDQPSPKPPDLAAGEIIG